MHFKHVVLIASLGAAIVLLLMMRPLPFYLDSLGISEIESPEHTDLTMKMSTPATEHGKVGILNRIRSESHEYEKTTQGPTLAPKSKRSGKTGQNRNVASLSAPNTDKLNKEPLSARQVADKMVASFLKTLGKLNSKGPIIVGGLGDSGTRGAVILLRRFGTEMLTEPFLRSINDKDSELFIQGYPVVTSSGKIKERSPHTIYPRPLMETQTLKYNSSQLPEDFWQTARQYASQMLNTSMHASLVGRNGSSPLDPWGFKHPRTSLLLPLWLDVLGDNFVFVHVIRDVKESIRSDNDVMLKYMCEVLLRTRCDNGDDVLLRAQSWAKYNREVFEYALESKMKAFQYYAIRIEDVVMQNQACLWRLRHYLNLNLDETRMQRRFKFALNSSQGHGTSYFGYRLGESERHLIEANLTSNRNLAKNISFWGYHTDRFELAKDCESLPWMDLFRKAKGALPGDGKIPPSQFKSAPWDVAQRPENKQKPIEI